MKINAAIESLDPKLALRLAAADMLTLEAHLLDDWELDKWLALFTQDATYEVPTAGARDNEDSSESLFYIADDYQRILYRVQRLKDQSAHSESPRSDSTRIVGGVQVLDETDTEIRVRSNFVTFRSKGEKTDHYFGHHLHTLRRIGDELKISAKRTMLDMANLRPHGRVSIII